MCYGHAESAQFPASSACDWATRIGYASQDKGHQNLDFSLNTATYAGFQSNLSFKNITSKYSNLIAVTAFSAGDYTDMTGLVHAAWAPVFWFPGNESRSRSPWNSCNIPHRRHSFV